MGFWTRVRLPSSPLKMNPWERITMDLSCCCLAEIQKKIGEMKNVLFKLWENDS